MAKFSIDVHFIKGLNAAQQAAFHGAAQRWAQIIVGDFPRIKMGTHIIEALTIIASGIPIDGGPSGDVLGQSEATDFSSNGLPAKGIMEFDPFNLGQMEADGSLQSVILHEMGHVIGIGTIWDAKQVLVGAKTANPTFTGPKADKEWAKLSKLPPKHLPVEIHGGDGTADSHCRETVFGSELMTGFISGVTQPLSRITVASLADLGYQVNIKKADAFALPSHLKVRALGVGADPERVRRCTLSNPRRHHFTPKHWPPSALV